MSKASKQAQTVKERVNYFRTSAARHRAQAENEERMAAAWERLQRRRDRQSAQEMETVAA